jgi:hypothetical protein
MKSFTFLSYNHTFVNENYLSHVKNKEKSTLMELIFLNFIV